MKERQNTDINNFTLSYFETCKLSQLKAICPNNNTFHGRGDFPVSGEEFNLKVVV